MLLTQKMKIHHTNTEKINTNPKQGKCNTQRGGGEKKTLQNFYPKKKGKIDNQRGGGGIRNAYKILAVRRMDRGYFV